jgi:hypothetical protein
LKFAAASANLSKLLSGEQFEFIRIDDAKSMCEGYNRGVARSRGETVILMLVGLVPVFLIMLVLWYATRDYFDVVGVGGLFKGVLFGWLLYLFLMFIGHVASPWRREIL